MDKQFCGISQETIDIMQDKGVVSPAFIDYLNATKNSVDPRDCVVHRKFIIEHNPTDPWRQKNNKICHPLDYKTKQ